MYGRPPLIKMAQAPIVDTRPFPYTWLNHYISPGPVGSVGDALLQVRLKHSEPSMPLRWDPTWSGQNEPRLGSNVSDGQYIGATSLGGPPRLLDSNWGFRTDFKYANGWRFTNVQIPDRSIQPVAGSTPDYSWHNKVATLLESRHTGEKFLPLPGPFQLGPGQVPRGGAVPAVTDIVGARLPNQDVIGGQVVQSPENREVLNEGNLSQEQARAAVYAANPTHHEQRKYRGKAPMGR